MSDVTVVAQPGAARAALNPIRRKILTMLEEPASSTELAEALGLARQKVNYHVTVLERHALI